MIRRAAASTLALILLSSLSAAAAENGKAPLPREPKRPAALSALYGTYAALQVMDFVTTQKAIHGGGATELNPVMGRGNPAQMIAVKAVGGAASVYFAEKMWKKNRAGAIVAMVAINSVSAAIVATNASHIKH